MSHEPNLEEIKKEYHGNLTSYFTGFFSCLFLTLLSFGAVIFQTPPLPFLVYAIVILALIQAVVQLKCFLKLGHEEKPHWQSVVFYFMVLVLLIIAAGTLWIMYDLNSRLMVM